jgi:hypothetical protein
MAKIKMLCHWIFNTEVQHDALEDTMIKIISVSRSMRKKPPISSKFCMVSKIKHWVFFGYLEAPWCYDSNKSIIKKIRGSYKRLWPNHRVQHVLKSVLDSTQRWSKMDIAPLFELCFWWMTTRWKCNFINFSIELYFDICSFLDRG